MGLPAELDKTHPLIEVDGRIFYIYLQMEQFDAEVLLCQMDQIAYQLGAGPLAPVLFRDDDPASPASSKFHVMSSVVRPSIGV